MWFLTIESIALLAIATTLGLFAGWLVWGGRPVLVSAEVANGSVPASFDGAKAELTDTLPKAPEAFTENQADELVEQSSVGSLPGGTWLSPEEIDPEASENVAESELVVAPQPRFLEPDLSVEDSLKTGNQQVGLRTESSDSVAARDVTATQLRAELEQLSAHLETREADVVRLKAKLRKAVEEIEKRTALAQAARAELLDHQHRFAKSLASLESNIAPTVDLQSMTSPSEDDDFALAGTRFTPAEIDELVQARTASLLIKSSQLERRTALIQNRAEEAEARLGELKAQSVQHQAVSEAAIVKAERDAAARILALEVDLASARQRTNMATQELMGFGTEISAIHDTNAKHLQSVHETMRDLRHRLDTTKAALAGRSLSPVKPATSANPIPGVPGATALEGSTLMILPGITGTVIDSLAELGISTVEDVASWTDEDVDYIQSLLPEDPEIVKRNGWVGIAQRSLHRTPQSSEG